MKTIISLILILSTSVAIASNCLEVSEDDKWLVDSCNDTAWKTDLSYLANLSGSEQEEYAKTTIYKTGYSCGMATKEDMQQLHSHHKPPGDNIFGFFVPIQVHDSSRTWVSYYGRYIARDAYQTWGTYDFIRLYFPKDKMKGNHIKRTGARSFNGEVWSLIGTWVVCKEKPDNVLWRDYYRWPYYGKYWYPTVARP